MADESAVMENVAVAPTADVKAQRTLTPEQKQAATLRRDATLLAKYGDAAKAKELIAQADALAPAPVTNKRVDPMTALNPADQKKLRLYFEATVDGFKRIAQYISYKKLAEIAATQK